MKEKEHKTSLKVGNKVRYGNDKLVYTIVSINPSCYHVVCTEPAKFLGTGYCSRGCVRSSYEECMFLESMKNEVLVWDLFSALEIIEHGE